MRIPFATVRDWVFDLDNTLYPVTSTLLGDVETRMTDYIAGALKLDVEAAAELRQRYFLEYGATVSGLARHHDVDVAGFLAHAHDVASDDLAPDPELNALIAALPGRKIVFTNSAGSYARRVLEHLGLADSFDVICDIESAQLAAKPQRQAYERVIALCGLSPGTSVLIEDTLRNLAPAHALGFITVLVGAVHPAPLPDYVDHYAHDLKAFLRAATRS